ncbi:MAG: hypothetical protein V3R99_05530, partial [Thermoguttaceae bacterium]
MRRIARRSGVSLLEVLIGTFVLSIGLLGLAALIPIGRFAIVETGKSDRAGTGGRGALRDVKVQRMLDPRQWRDLTLARLIDPPLQPQFPNDPTTGEPMAAFAIDPMQIARAAVDGTLADVARFPYDSNATLSMSRITLASMLDITTGNLSLPLARRTFVWRDELLFEMPEDATGRPRRLVRDGTDVSSGKVGPYPNIFGNETIPFTNAPLVPQIDENYSWMVTVTPAYVENTLAAAEKCLYSVSIVVFWKRDYSVDAMTERAVTADMFGGGYGGGDVRLET